MKIAVVAANGRSGQAFVQAALAAGHTVHAGIHGKDTLRESSNLIKFDCDATNRADVARLIQGTDAVVSMIGHVKGSPHTVQTDAMRNIISVMGAAHISRIVSLTGTGVRFAGDKIPLIDRVANVAIRLIDPNRIKDGIMHVDVLKNSTADWTLLRVLKLQGDASTHFRLSLHGPTKLFVSRSDVARAVLEVLEAGSFKREAPILSRP